MSHFESTAPAKYNPKDLELFRKDITSFGLEVLKFSRKGAPASRTILINSDKMELAWVGKGGKRNQIDLNSVAAVRAGCLPSDSDGSEEVDMYPSDRFKKHGVPGNANLYVSLYLEGEDANGRDTFDIQCMTPPEAKKFHSVLMSLCPNVASTSQVLVKFPER